MKKLFALLMAMAMLLTLAACNKEPAETTPPAAENSAMSYAEYMAAEIDAKVTIEAYVQATQSWWDNKITVYAQDADGAYFLYEMACTEEDAAKLVPGTKIRVTGDKAEWAGEIEIMNATFEFIEGADTFVAEPLDVTALLGTDGLIEKQNQKVKFNGLTIEAVSFKNDEPGDDIYVTVGYNDASYEFCVERYLTDPDTEVYQEASDLTIGDVVNIEGFLYWYEGVNTHITDITVVTEGIDMDLYAPYLGTWYADGSSASYRFVLTEELTWQYIDADAEVLFSGNIRISDEGMHLYDPEGVLAIVLSLESEKEAFAEIYMDTMMDYLSTYTFLNEITNDDPGFVAIGGEDVEEVIEPTEDISPEDSVLPEEDTTVD